MVIKTLEDLADWNLYRKQTRDSLAKLTAGDAVYISVEDFDFDVRGTPWPGRVALFGAQGATTMAALKQKGMPFRPGQASLAPNGTTVLVQGLTGGFLKGANKTLAKLSVGFVLEAGAVTTGEVEEKASEREQPEKESRKGPEKKPEKQPEKQPQQPQGRQQEAAEAEAEEAEAEEGEGEAIELVSALDEAKERQEALLKIVREELGKRPELRGDVTEFVRRAEKQEKAGEFDDLLATYDELEDLVTDAGDEDDEAVAKRIDVHDWKQYRLFLRPRLLAAARGGDQAEPVFVSRQPFEFQKGSQQREARLVLAGRRSLPLVKRLRREGTKFFEGTCRVGGDAHELIVDGIASGACKAGSKTLKLFRLGFSLVVGDEDVVLGTVEGDGLATQYAAKRAELAPLLAQALATGRGDTSGLRAADAAARELAEAGEWPRALSSLGRIERLLQDTGTGSGTGVIEPGLVSYRKSLVQFAQVKTEVRNALAALHGRIAEASGEPELAAEVTSRLTAKFTAIDEVVDRAINASKDDRAPVTEAVRAAVTSTVADIDGDEVIAYVEKNSWGVRIRAPLLAALRGILDAMPPATQPAAG